MHKAFYKTIALVILTLGLSPGLVAADDDDDEGHSKFAGAYLGSFNGGVEIPAQITINSDGTLQSTDATDFGIFGVLQDMCNGAWKKDGRRQIAIRLVCFTYEDPVFTGTSGTLFNVSVVDGYMSFNKRFNTFTGTFDQAFYDLSVDPLDANSIPFFTIQGIPVEGRRITVP